jgi:pyrroline-5-carboxylate reductase
MKIGFIGTGKITTSVITGLFRSKANLKQILISERSKKNSRALAKRFKQVKVVKDNQEIINRSNWVVLAVVPTVAKKILQDLQFKKGQTVISFVSTLNMKDLRKFTSPATLVFKAAPLPMVESKLGPIVLYPSNNKVNALFNKIGTVINAKNEKENNYLWTLTAGMATYLELCATLEHWLVQRKVNAVKAKRMVTSLVFGLSHTLLLSKQDTRKLVKEYQTKKGINEELLLRLKKDKVFDKLNKNLNTIFARIKKANDQ